MPARHDEPAYCALFNSETVGGNDWISGEDGDDRIEGGLGDDIIYGGYGADNTAGETGNDVIFAIDNRVDTIVCGTGSDVVTSDRNDIVAATARCGSAPPMISTGGDQVVSVCVSRAPTRPPARRGVSVTPYGAYVSPRQRQAVLSRKPLYQANTTALTSTAPRA